MEITREQSETVRSGKPVRLSEAGTDLVLVRADGFRDLQTLQYDADSWTDEEMDLLAAEDADSLGWEGMDVYQDLDP